VRAGGAALPVQPGNKAWSCADSVCSGIETFREEYNHEPSKKAGASGSGFLKCS